MGGAMYFFRHQEKKHSINIRLLADIKLSIRLTSPTILYVALRSNDISTNQNRFRNQVSSQTSTPC